MVPPPNGPRGALDLLVSIIEQAGAFVRLSYQKPRGIVPRQPEVYVATKRTRRKENLSSRLGVVCFGLPPERQ
jgi:hypothetical protein